MFPYRDDNPSHHFPFITISLIVINTVIFFLFATQSYYEAIVFQYGFIPNEWRPVSLITAMFLHGGLFHLVFNMWFLWLFGDNLEDQLGKIIFVIFYLTGGIFSFLVHAAMTGGGIPTIGASGAISAVMGGYVVLFPHARIRMVTFLFFYVFRWAWNAWIFLGLWFLQQLFFNFGGDTASQIAYGAHIGGFIFGFIAMTILKFFLPNLQKFQ